MWVTVLLQLHENLGKSLTLKMEVDTLEDWRVALLASIEPYHKNGTVAHLEVRNSYNYLLRCDCPQRSPISLVIHLDVLKETLSWYNQVFSWSQNEADYNERARALNEPEMMHQSLIVSYELEFLISKMLKVGIF